MLRLLMGIGLVASILFADEDVKLPKNCTLLVGSGHLTAGGRCWNRNEVMTGVFTGDPSYIYCSRLYVNCTEEETKEAKAQEKIDK